MSFYSTVSSKEIVAKIFRDSKLNFDSWVIDAYEWSAEALDNIFVHKISVDKAKVIKIENYRGELPKDRILSPMVFYSETATEDSELKYFTKQLFYEGNNFTRYFKDINNPSSININRAMSEESFNIVNGIIQTTFEEGYLAFYWKGLPVDLEGFPLIPDEFNCREAIKWYIYTRLLEQGISLRLPLNFVEAEQRWKVYSMKAKNHLKMPSELELERLYNNHVNLIPIDYRKEYIDTNAPGVTYSSSTFYMNNPYLQNQLRDLNVVVKTIEASLATANDRIDSLEENILELEDRITELETPVPPSPPTAQEILDALMNTLRTKTTTFSNLTGLVQDVPKQANLIKVAFAPNFSTPLTHPTYYNFAIGGNILIQGILDTGDDFETAVDNEMETGVVLTPELITTFGLPSQVDSVDLEGRKFVYLDTYIVIKSIVPNELLIFRRDSLTITGLTSSNIKVNYVDIDYVDYIAPVKATTTFDCSSAGGSMPDITLTWYDEGSSMQSRVIPGTTFGGSNLVSKLIDSFTNTPDSSIEISASTLDTVTFRRKTDGNNVSSISFSGGFTASQNFSGGASEVYEFAVTSLELQSDSLIQIQAYSAAVLGTSKAELKLGDLVFAQISGNENIYGKTIAQLISDLFAAANTIAEFTLTSPASNQLRISFTVNENNVYYYNIPITILFTGGGTIEGATQNS